MECSEDKKHGVQQASLSDIEHRWRKAHGAVRSSTCSWLLQSEKGSRSEAENFRSTACCSQTASPPRWRGQTRIPSHCCSGSYLPEITQSHQGYRQRKHASQWQEVCTHHTSRHWAWKTVKLTTWQFNVSAHTHIHTHTYTQGDWKVAPYCGSLQHTRYREWRKLPHYDERGNLASYQYLGEYWRFNFHARWRSSTLCYCCCSLMAERALPWEMDGSWSNTLRLFL